MKDFRLFDIYDFLMDEDFIRWVKERRKTDNDFWNNWLIQHPDKHIIIAEARRILETIGSVQDPIDESEKELEVNRLLHTIEEQSMRQPDLPIRSITNNKKWWYAAATLFIALAGAVSYFLLKSNATLDKYDYASITPSKRLIENVNTSGKPVRLRLPDESVVELSPNSRIAYPNNFDSADTRDVYLLGEALFSVTKNPARPFRVFANEIVTKVLGTSFIIRSFEKDSTIKVVVKTGKVSVYSQTTVKETAVPNRLGGIILSPNQELVYQKSKQKFQKILLDDPVMIVPVIADKNLLYEDVTLEKVFDQLSKNYGISIVFDNELLKKCTITADLRNVPFYEKLELICKAIGARYEIIDGQVVIQTSGCE
ncbi:MAG TPA: FecR family protein [Chitinophagaceae bacterium]|nr:FecR family protein [Chitinophagaceae bacterium]